MTVIALTAPYSLKACVLSIATDDYTAAVSQVQFDPSSSPTTWRGIGGNIVKDSPIPDWACTVGLAQDTATASLTRYLLANSGLTKPVVFTPVAGGPAVSASVIILPGSLGGTADGNLATATVQLPVIGTPVLAPNTAAAPVVSTVTPASAAVTTQIIVKGTGFLTTVPTTGVKVGATNATSWIVLDDFTIAAIMPAGSAGATTVTVTNAVGASNALPYTRGA